MINLTKNLEEAKFVTHAGNFHADDVFSTVFLSKLYGDITVIRLKDYLDDGSKIAYDIGLGKFDHHQSGYDKKRENKIHYCGFGLLWQEYGLEYLKKNNVNNKEEVFKIMDKLLVTQIDAFDNGELVINTDINVYTLPGVIEMFRPKYDSNDDEDECFKKACDFAKVIFDLILEDAQVKAKSMEIIKEKSKTMQEKVLILDKYIPYEFAIFELGLDIEFVVYPSNRGGYAAHTVPIAYKSFTPKVPFKSEWAGLRDAKLQEVSGIKTARFCHNKLFLATADTLEDAIEFVNKTIRVRN